MAKVVAQIDRNTGEKESVESMLRRFKKQVLKDDIMWEVKRRQYFVPKSVARKLKSIEAIKRSKNKKRR
jgi:small subunit ribosomal protein S21